MCIPKPTWAAVVQQLKYVFLHNKSGSICLGTCIKKMTYKESCMYNNQL